MSHRTFLVEDNEVIRVNLGETLHELADVAVVGHSDRAFDASVWLSTQGDDWDLAVVDLYLKEGSGFSVLAACRVRKPSQRVVVLSNFVTADTRQRCIAFGADAVFDKSTQVDALIDYCIAL